MVEDKLCNDGRRLANASLSPRGYSATVTRSYSTRYINGLAVRQPRIIKSELTKIDDRFSKVVIIAFGSVGNDSHPFSLNLYRIKFLCYLSFCPIYRCPDMETFRQFNPRCVRKRNNLLIKFIVNMTNTSTHGRSHLVFVSG